MSYLELIINTLINQDYNKRIIMKKHIIIFSFFIISFCYSCEKPTSFILKQYNISENDMKTAGVVILGEEAAAFFIAPRIGENAPINEDAGHRIVDYENKTIAVAFIPLVADYRRGLLNVKNEEGVTPLAKLLLKPGIVHNIINDTAVGEMYYKLQSYRARCTSWKPEIRKKLHRIRAQVNDVLISTQQRKKSRL